MKTEIIIPEEIEKKSFEIIRSELEKSGIKLDPRNEAVVIRAIHTTADFEYAATMAFSENAVDKLKELIRNGSDIVTDTNMAAAGINKGILAKYNCKLSCYMADDDVAKAAGSRGITRAAISMEKAAETGDGIIFCIGNAPTALIKLNELMYEGYKPGFIIGVPVGFVNVCEAKELIMDSNADYIVNRGRKGGSTVAAAIVNAILYSL